MEPKAKLSHLPPDPGIYIMKGAKERVLYVGKAKNLRNRLRSYFQQSSSLDSRKLRMVQQIKDFEYIVTKNELEALILESNFIKRFKPPYNIILRDDKNYPYIKLTANEPWPRIDVVRKTKWDGALYFGPYVPAGAMWEMLDFIRRNFSVRMCRYNLDKPFRPCVQYQMGRCLAPCAETLRGPEARKKYLETVDEVTAFIRGERRELLQSLQDRMARCSRDMQYEEAAAIRDRLRVLEKAWESQRVIDPKIGDIDVIGLYSGKQDSSVFMLFIRNGMMIGQKEFFLKRIAGMEDGELIESFIGQFYAKEMIVPPRIILPVQRKFPTLNTWLTQRRGSSVRLGGARGERERKLLRMASDNALFAYNSHKDRRVDATLLAIKELLGLRQVPISIGAVDISNISGSEAVGAFVLYEGGVFSRDRYRLFKIRTVAGADDFAMIGEVVARYLKEAASDHDDLPRLMLIDGGRGQLESALGVIKDYSVPLEVAALAKARERTQVKKGAQGIRTDLERIYLPGRKRPVCLDPSAASTHILQKIRDEVHRAAVSYHRKVRSRRTLSSPLEKIKGIGKARRLLLLKHFGSLDKIREASVDEVASIRGINREMAAAVKEAIQ